MQVVFGGRNSCYPRRYAWTARIGGFFNCHHQHGLGMLLTSLLFGLSRFVSFLVTKGSHGSGN